MMRKLVECECVTLHTLDVDECLAGTHLCNQTCTNNIGSYTCGCRLDYRLNEDGLNCEGAGNEFSLRNYQSKPLTLQ